MKVVFPEQTLKTNANKRPGCLLSVHGKKENSAFKSQVEDPRWTISLCKAGCFTGIALPAVDQAAEKRWIHGVFGGTTPLFSCVLRILL